MIVLLVVPDQTLPCPTAVEARRVKNVFLELLKSEKASAIVIAHRGDSAHAPENTLEAARLGWEAGAEAWELDVQLTRDGVAVVIHDESLVRTTDVEARHPGDPRGRAGYRVIDFDWSEIRELDAGSWFVSELGGRRSAQEFGTLAGLDVDRRRFYRSGDIRIPTLEEALALTVELDWLVNVEIKSFPEQSAGTGRDCPGCDRANGRRVASAALELRSPRSRPRRRASQPPVPIVAATTSRGTRRIAPCQSSRISFRHRRCGHLPYFGAGPGLGIGRVSA